MLILNLFLLCSTALAAVTTPYYSEEPEDLKLHFEEYIVTHGKKYADESEKTARFEIFKQNVAEINRKNSNPIETAFFVVNKFTDLTKEEFLQTYTGFNANLRPEVKYENIPRYETVPETFDWREKNAVTHVKDQAHCGSCWAFGVTGTIEGAFSIKHGKLIELSEQQLVDCDRKNNGCHGGNMQMGIKYVVDVGGLEGETDYPYKADRFNCTFDKSKVRATVTKVLAYDLKNAEDTKQLLIQNGPIVIGVDANDFGAYGGGIVTECETDRLNHAVLLVGYGEENGTKFWIIKNSWGEDWGESGYIRLAYSEGDNPCGMYNGDAAGVEMA